MSHAANPSFVIIYAAERVAGPDGSVERGETPLTDDEAIERLKGGSDVVVCSTERRPNRNKARELTVTAFGDFVEDAPHGGRMALPHFHPSGRTPNVHAFDEAPPRHAKRRSKSK